MMFVEQEQELKLAADSVLCEVRRKQADVKRMQDILRSLEKLRKLRKEAASRKGESSLILSFLFFLWEVEFQCYHGEQKETGEGRRLTFKSVLSIVSVRDAAPAWYKTKCKTRFYLNLL